MPNAASGARRTGSIPIHAAQRPWRDAARMSKEIHPGSKAIQAAAPQCSTRSGLAASGDPP
jgi:hypothetical protein